MKNLILACVVALLLPATAFAGGGSKSTTSIRVTNNGARTLAVIVNPPSGFNVSSVTVDEFKKHGGVLLNKGEAHSFDAKNGTYVVAGAYVNANGSRGTAATKSIDIHNSGVVNVSAVGNTAGVPVFTVK